MNESIPSGADQSADAVERIAKDLLEALDSLAIVYECADSFSRLFDAPAIADFVLERVLEAVGARCGAVYLDEGGKLEPRAERAGCAALLAPGAVGELAGRGRAAFLHAAEAEPWLAPAARHRALLHAPLSDGRRTFGRIIVLGAVRESFSTADLKLVTAVGSQAAIALSGCYHFAEVLLERQKLHSVIRDNAEGIVVLEPDGRTALTNAAARALLGCAPDEAEGFDLFARAVRDWRGAEELLALRRGERTEVHGELVRGAGRSQRVVAYAARALRGTDGRVANLLLSVHDLTEKRREDRLKRNFLALVSHKLRTPLAAVKGIVSMLQDETSSYAPKPAERTELLGAVDERIDELAGLLDRLLAMVEVLEGSWSSPGRSDLREICAQAVEAVALRAEKNAVAIEVSLEEHARTVSIPASRLRLVLDNLLDNALKFGARRGGRIRLSSAAGADGFVELECEDDGPGLSRSDGAVLFESFCQRDDEFTGSVPGMGIGLALVREIARKVGGSAELVGGFGSRFRVRLPRG